jgi:hypothetical protein
MAGTSLPLYYILAFDWFAVCQRLKNSLQGRLVCFGKRFNIVFRQAQNRANCIGVRILFHNGFAVFGFVFFLFVHAFARQLGATVEQIAEKLGKSVRSVVAKLSREGVYKKKEYKTKNGEAVVKKDAHADAIGAILGLPENDIESLTKANKSALKAIFEALANSKPIEG